MFSFQLQQNHKAYERERKREEGWGRYRERAIQRKKIY